MSAKLKVVLLRRYFPEDLAYLKSRLVPGVELIEPKDQSPSALADAAADADVLLGGAVPEPVLANAKKLKLLQVPWTGVDTLDFDLLRRYRPVVANSHSNAAAVAEYAVSLLLSLLKAIPLHDRKLREGDWARPKPGSKEGFVAPRPLSGRTVGFLGYGAIGSRIAGLLEGFKPRFMAVANRKRDTPRPLERLGGPGELGEMLPKLDVLFLTAPLTRETRGLLDEKALSKLRPDAVLVNVSRAELVDEGALYSALKEGRLGGAAIDAWSLSPSAQQPLTLPSKHPFHELPNVVLSPHRAGYSAGELPHLADAIENINRLARGEKLQNVVDLEAGY